MIQLNYRDSRPIYEQIKDGFRHLIVKGILQKDDKYPSVRELASKLAINPNTIQRAYRELEQEGYLYSVAGKGSFVAGIPEGDSTRKMELLKTLHETVTELGYLGMSLADVIEEIKKAELEQNKENAQGGKGDKK